MDTGRNDVLRSLSETEYALVLCTCCYVVQSEDLKFGTSCGLLCSTGF